MLKKISLSLILACGLFAGNDIDIYGEIVGANASTHELTLKVHATNENIVVKLNNGTKIELDNCGVMGRDIKGTFADLKVGQSVKVEVYNTPNNTPIINYVAKEVEYKCVK